MGDEEGQDVRGAGVPPAPALTTSNTWGGGGKPESTLPRNFNCLTLPPEEGAEDVAGLR